jgi:hypothetical protein
MGVLAVETRPGRVRFELLLEIGILLESCTNEKDSRRILKDNELVKSVYQVV